MTKYILKRLGFSLLALFVLVTLIFFIMQLLPGYPITMGTQETAEQFQQRLSSLGLDRPIIVQYGDFLGKIFTSFSFGTFFNNGADVATIFFRGIGFTLPIAAVAFVIGIFLGMVFGSISAVFRGKWQDTLVNIFAVFFLSVPSFVIATFIIKIASSAGASTTIPIPGSSDYDVGKAIGVSMLAVLSLVFALTPSITYYTRNELVDVLNQDYIKTALAKGLTYRAVIFKHGIRNALIPIISISVPSFLIVIGGSLVVERFFGIPGAATELISAIERKEFYYVMFNVMFISFIYFILQILADISYTIIDPRIKLAQSNEMSLFRKMLYFFKRNKNASDWRKTVAKNTYFEVEENSLLYQHIKENNLIQNNEIHFSENAIDMFDLNLTKDIAVLDDRLYKVYFKNDKNVEGV